MQLAVVQEADADRLQQRDDQLGLAAAATIGAGVAAVGLRTMSIGAPCPILHITGVPCPGCGMTRLADHLLHGEVIDALARDPAGVLFALVIAVLAAGFVLQRITRRRLTSRLRAHRAPPVLLVLVAVHWVTTIVTGGFVAG